MRGAWSDSLQREEKLSLSAISPLLCRKPQWVAKRLQIATRLSEVAQLAVAQGRVGPTLAHALCSLPEDQQDVLLVPPHRPGGSRTAAPEPRAASAREPEWNPSDSRQQIVKLHSFCGTREIARRMMLSRKIVRRVLAEEGCLSTTAPRSRAASKLEPFRTSIEANVTKGPTVTRILREIRQLGYTGGRTILAEAVRSLQSSLQPAVRRKNAPKRRFETPRGQEMQIDWSPYTLKIGGLTQAVFAFSCLLAASPKLWVHFYCDERQSTVLEALAATFQYFAGCALQVVMDNMTTAILGR